MEKERLRELIASAAFEEGGRKKLACADAFKLADKYRLELSDIARVCNEENIRISRCQLGCFR